MFILMRNAAFFSKDFSQISPKEVSLKHFFEENFQYSKIKLLAFLT